MVSFNVTKFCYLAGNFFGISEIHRQILFASSILICFSLLVVNALVVISIIRKHEQFLTRKKIFIVSLVLIEIMSSFTVIPLFIVELSEKQLEVECKITSWRVVFFIYTSSTRILCIFFLSIDSYIKTCHQASKISYWFDKCNLWVCTCFIWLPGIVAIISIAYSDLQPGKRMGTLVLIYFIILIVCCVSCYGMVIKSIREATQRMSTDIYKTALRYIKMVLIWFLLTNVPLTMCGAVLVFYAFHPKEKIADHVIVLQIYITCLMITSLEALVNPVLFIYTYDKIRDIVFGCWPRCSREQKRESILL